MGTTVGTAVGATVGTGVGVTQGHTRKEKSLPVTETPPLVTTVFAVRSTATQSGAVFVKTKRTKG